MKSYPKKIKRRLRELLAQAYERELQRELTKLDQSFSEWRSGHISSTELSDRIHHYEIGPLQELFNRYDTRSPEIVVAYAIVTGILNRDEIPEELLQAIAGPLSFYQSLKDRGELREPDDF